MSAPADTIPRKPLAFALRMSRPSRRWAAGAREVNPDVVGPVDVVIHLAPAPPPEVGGRLVSATTPAGTHFIVRNDAGDLAELVALVDAGVVRVEVADRRPITELAAVHREAERGALTGKTVLSP